jgi:lipopolysaccharide transport system ATP-binding protein
LIRARNVSKVYSLYPKPSDRLWEAMAGKQRHAEFTAVNNVSFDVQPGEMLALVGPNGSGKSTLLQMVAGILEPSTGSIVVDGRVAALLELGTGFNPEFTGRENVYLNAEILGRTRAQTEAAFSSIADFAAIGAYMDRPMKEYSSGMYVRLAFSAAIHVDPEVLIVDEALAVGDAIFANQCIRKFDELKSRGVTLLFVSHDLGLVKRLADRALLMWKGEAVFEGDPAEVANRYVGLAHTNKTAEATPRGTIRHGDGASEISSVHLVVDGRIDPEAFESGASVQVKIAAKALRDLHKPVVGMLIRSRLGTDAFGTNTKIESKPLDSLRAGQHFEVQFAFNCLLAPGEYTLTVATQNDDGTSQDWRDDALAFRITDQRAVAGLASFPVQLCININNGGTPND